MPVLSLQAMYESMSELKMQIESMVLQGSGTIRLSVAVAATGTKAERISSFVLFQVLIRFTSPLQARGPGSAVLRCGLLLSVIPASRCHQVMLLITVWHCCTAGFVAACKLCPAVHSADMGSDEIFAVWAVLTGLHACVRNALSHVFALHPAVLPFTLIWAELYFYQLSCFVLLFFFFKNLTL